MPRSKHASPTLNLTLTEEQRETAIRSNSGGCLIADAIKSQYPNLSNVTVDMATVRVTDRALGVRFTYLTPPDAQHVLLSFDQGWPSPTTQLVIRRAVHIRRIRQVDAALKRRAERRAARVAELEAKQAAGKTLTKAEKISLAKSKARLTGPERPTSTDPRDVKMTNTGPVIHGGQAPVLGPAHPNLLRGRNRHFGAKLADPGQAFRDAVEAAVAEREAAKDQP